MDETEGAATMVLVALLFPQSFGRAYRIEHLRRSVDLEAILGASGLLVAHVVNASFRVATFAVPRLRRRRLCGLILPGVPKDGEHFLYEGPALIGREVPGVDGLLLGVKPAKPGLLGEVAVYYVDYGVDLLARQPITAAEQLTPHRGHLLTGVAVGTIAPADSTPIALVVFHPARRVRCRRFLTRGRNRPCVRERVTRESQQVVHEALPRHNSCRLAPDAGPRPRVERYPLDAGAVPDEQGSELIGATRPHVPPPARCLGEEVPTGRPPG